MNVLCYLRSSQLAAEMLNVLGISDLNLLPGRLRLEFKRGGLELIRGRLELRTAWLGNQTGPLGSQVGWLGTQKGPVGTEEGGLELRRGQMDQLAANMVFFFQMISDLNLLPKLN